MLQSNQPHTFVVITLDPPIRKGQTFYPHIVLQFPSEEIAECALSMNEELLNTKYKDRLQPSYKVSWLSNLPTDMYVGSFCSSPSEVPCPVTVACYALLADTHLFLWPWCYYYMFLNSGHCVHTGFVT
jgi:hypothetical protein